MTPDFPAFEQELRRRKIFDAEEMSDEYPSNWEEIQKILGQERDTPEPTPTEHKGFRRRVVNTGNEAAVMASVPPKLLNILVGVTRGVEKIQWVRNQSSNGQSSSHNFRSFSS